jgi:hypothetical protein
MSKSGTKRTDAAELFTIIMLCYIGKFVSLVKDFTNPQAWEPANGYNKLVPLAMGCQTDEAVSPAEAFEKSAVASAFINDARVDENGHICQAGRDCLEMPGYYSWIVSCL